MEYIIPVNCFMFADTENIERFKLFFLSCMGEEKIEKDIAQMKKDNISSLIIDVRNNAGGADDAGAIIAEQFAKEDLFYLKETTYDRDSGEYIENRTLKMNAKNSIDVPIYLLVNSNCISAGEGFAYNLAKLPQVTVVGIQGTNGSCSKEKV